MLKPKVSARNRLISILGSVSNRVVELLLATMNRIFGRHFIWLAYPPQAEAAPRWGYGKPSSPVFAKFLDGTDGAVTDALTIIARYSNDLSRIKTADDPEHSSVATWNNVYMPGLDAAAIYSFLRKLKPANYVEIGSGISTLFADRARTDGALATKFSSIDPSPRAEVDAICDEVVRAPLEAADLSVFDRLGPGDILFMDGSHIAFPNNDVPVFYLEVLPALPPGIIVGIHDIFFPDDYPMSAIKYHYNEQYVFAAYLAGGAPIEILLPTYHAATAERFAPLRDAIWDDPAFADVNKGGYSFWFKTV
jgi:hypothetical protein